MAASICVHAAYADSPWFTRVWSADEGLPNAHVTALAQSHDGYVWVATTTGLARFDGSHFTPVSFRGVDGNQSFDPGVGGVMSLADGGVLISRIRGPVIHVSADGASLAVVPTGEPVGVMPLSATQDKAGAIWIGYADGAVVRVQGRKVRRFDDRDGVPKFRTIYALTCDASGTVWLAKGENIVFFRDGRFHPFTALGIPLRPPEKLRLRAARNGGVWVVNRQGRLWWADADGHVKYIGAALPESTTATALMVVEDHTGAVWIGTDLAGLIRYANGRFERVPTSLPSITSLLETADGAIWAGTAGGGLDRLSRRRVQWDDLGGNGAQIGALSVAEDASGTTWVVTTDGRVITRSDAGWIHEIAGSFGVATCVVKNRDGGVWIGTREGDLFWSHDGLLTKVAGPEVTGGYISALFAASNGDLWLGRYFGTFRVLRLREGKWQPFNVPEQADRIHTITEDRAGRIWIGTRQGFLLRPEGDRLVDETIHSQMKRWPIEMLVARPDGALWIAYSGLGLGRLKEGRFTLLNNERGLPDNYLSQVISDDRGWAWFGADHGVFKIRWRELEDAMDGRLARVRPVLFGASEGLHDIEASNGVSPGGIRTRDGRVWLPLSSGIAIADPTLADEAPPKPSVYLTSVVVGDQTVASYDSALASDSGSSLQAWRGPLPLRPDQTRVVFEFAAVDFTAPENLRYRCRLDGLDDRWVEIGAERRATYSRIGPGHYAFHVQASVGDGPWIEATRRFEIQVVPYFWQTSWFRAIVLLVVTIASAAIARAIANRRFRQRVRVLEQQTALERERARIGRDLHDDLGGALTQVALMLDLTGRESADGARERLGQCSTMVRQVAKSVDEIIWAINPRNDTIPYLVDYLSQFVVEFLHSANVRCRVDLPDPLPDRKVTPETRHHLFLAVKETLANIIRHAHATQVDLRITVDDTSLAVEIKDNGQGFESAPNNSTSDGLRNMRERMGEIGGRFEIASQRGAGTRVLLVCRWARDG